MEIGELPDITMECGICGEKSLVKAPHCVYCFADFEEAKSNTFAYWFAKFSFILWCYVAFWSIFFLLLLIAKFNFSPDAYTEIEPYILPQPVFHWIPILYIIILSIDLKSKVYAKTEDIDKAACEIYMMYPILRTAVLAMVILFAFNFYFSSKVNSDGVNNFDKFVLKKNKNINIEFKDYPVFGMYTGNAAKVILATEQDRYFRTRLRETRDMPVNFAGEYVFNSWGCGTGCSFGAAVSHRTGKAVFFPYPNFIGASTCVGQYHDEDDGHFNFYENSRLIKVFGTDEMFGGEHGTKLEIRFYEFDSNEFKLVKSFPLKCQN